MSNRPFYRYLVVFAVVLAVFLLLPIPLDYAKAFIRAGSQRDAKTMIFGASTIDETSQCDTDQRTIAQMLAQKIDKPVADASRNGIIVEGMVNVAAVVGKVRKLDTTIIATGWHELLESDALSVHDAITFRELNPELMADSPIAYYHGLDSLFAGHEKLGQTFVYDGVSYPGSVRGLFEAEKAARTCPENDGQNREGIAATYYHNVVEYTVDPAIVRLLISFSQDQAAKQRAVVFLLVPINFDLMGRLNPAWPDIVKKRRDDLLSELRARGVRVLDLSEALPNNEFIDRWCGCSHFSQAGRLLVANRLGEFLNTMTVAGKI